MQDDDDFELGTLAAIELGTLLLFIAMMFADL